MVNDISISSTAMRRPRTSDDRRSTRQHEFEIRERWNESGITLIYLTSNKK